MVEVDAQRDSYLQFFNKGSFNSSDWLCIALNGSGILYQDIYTRIRWIDALLRSRKLIQLMLKNM